MEPINVKDLPYYSRWAEIVRKKQMSAKTKTEVSSVCKEWSRPAKTGLVAFIAWIESKLKENPEICKGDFYIRRMNAKLPYSPSNCYLEPIAKWKSKQVTTEEKDEESGWNAESISRLESIFIKRPVETREHG